MGITVDIQRNWDSIALQTEGTTPSVGHSIVLMWHIEPARCDAGVPAEIAMPIVRALTAMGDVAFRWSGAPVWRQEQASVIAAPIRDPISRMIDWFKTSWPTDVVVTRSPEAALHLFEHDWALQGQVAMVLRSPYGDTAPAIAALRMRRTWHDFDLAPPVIALMAPIVDGAGAHFTTASPAETEELLRGLSSAFAKAEIKFQVPEG